MVLFYVLHVSRFLPGCTGTCVHIVHTYMCTARVHTCIGVLLYYMFTLLSFFSFSRLNACKWQITAKDNPVEFNYKDAHN
jgi:hypothetical protein